MAKFVHPHVHSVYSIRDGLNKIRDLVDKSIEYDEAFALTDHGVIAGWMEYANVAKEKGIKPIFGIELYVNQYRKQLFKVLKKLRDEDFVDEAERKKLNQERDELKTHARHLVLIAKNETGFYNIIKIANEAYVDYFYNRPLVDYDALFSMKKDKDGTFGVILTTACLASPLARFIEKKKVDEAMEWVKEMKSHFGCDMYLEVQANHIKEQRALNKIIIAIADKTKTKMILGDDAHYLEKEDSEAHQDLLLLQDKKTKSDVGKIDIRVTYENKKGEVKSKKVAPGKEFRKDTPVEKLKKGMKVGSDVILSVEEVPRVWTFSSDNLYFRSEEEAIKDINKTHKELVDVMKRVLKSNYEIYDKIEHVQFNTDVKLPSIDGASEKMVALIRQGMKEKNMVERKYVDRVKFELDIIKRFNFETYFLILHDVIQYAKDNNIPIGVSRGSVAGSFIAYLIGLHRVNPFDPKWDQDGKGLPFERFLDLSKLYDKIIVTDENGNEHEFLEIDEISVTRGAMGITIQAGELKEGDEIHG
jgi:DNA polymerase III subunit alpha